MSTYELDPYGGPPLDIETDEADAEADALLEIAADPTLAEQHVQDQTDRYCDLHPTADRASIEAQFRKLASAEATSPDITPRLGLGG